MALTLVSRGAQAAIFTLTRTTTSWEWATITTSNKTGTRIPAGTYLVRMENAGGVFGKVRFNIANVPTDITVDGERIVTLSGDADLHVNGLQGIDESQLGAVGTLLLTPVTPLSLSLVAFRRALRGGWHGVKENRSRRRINRWRGVGRSQNRKYSHRHRQRPAGNNHPAYQLPSPHERQHEHIRRRYRVWPRNHQREQRRRDPFHRRELLRNSHVPHLAKSGGGRCGA